MRGFIYILKMCLLLTVTLGLCGCATLSYVGDDYNPGNTFTVKTNEDLVFNVYKKSLDSVNVKVGITRTSVVEILALIVQIENLSYETPYTFKVEDLALSSPEKAIQLISSNTYLSVWQTQEANSMSSVGSLGSTISTMTGINNNFNDYNQAIVQSNDVKDTQSAYKRLDIIGNQIMQHTVRVSSVVSPRKSQYYYFFFEDGESYPITVKYKNLVYKFNM